MRPEIFVLLGKTLGHYTITDLLGRGGMGEVYRAHDTRLERDVALKVLPAEMAADPEGLERFEREAKAVAALNHPHIVTLFSVERDGEHRFLTMELVEGEGLDQDLPAGGLPVERVLEIGIAIADALAAAHEKGIVHRDLKPANIMVTSDGRVKVLDFGLAKLAAPVGAEEVAGEEVSPEEATVTQAAPLTAVGSFLGTAHYMSPEQVRGQEVDARSDLFSLGVVLYELATGQRPFQGSTMSDVVSSILRDAPQPLEKRRPEAPKPLGRIVERCLAKEPGERAASAQEVRDELRGLQAEMLSGAVLSGAAPEDPATVVRRPPETRGSRRTFFAMAGAVLALAAAGVGWWLTRDSAPTAAEVATTPDRTIAVLPFANQSDDPSQEYFSDGISEELLNLLTQVPQLRVTSRSSSFSFKGQNVGVAEIAEQLGVAHVLEGSVRRAGDRVRITAQLIDTRTDTQQWSQSYDRTLEDIFAIQDEIAADVVEQLEVVLLGRAPTVRTTDPEAYALYLRAREISRLNTAEALDQADALLQRVLEIDPDYALAWVQMSVSSRERSRIGLLPAEEAFRHARESAERALEIDPNLAQGHAALGYLAMVDGELLGAARHYERALELAPADSDVLTGSASLLMSLGRLEESISLLENVVERDPLTARSRANLGLRYMSSGRFDETISTWQALMRLRPGRGSIRA